MMHICCPHQWIEQSSQTSVGDVGDVGVVEGAEDPKHDEIHSHDQQDAVTNSEIISSLEMTQKDENSCRNLINKWNAT